MDELDVFSNLSPTDGANASLLLKEQASQKVALALREGNSSESVLTDLSEQPEVGSIHSAGSGGRVVEEEKKNSRMAAPTNRAAPTGGAMRAGSVASVCSSSGTGGSGCANEDSLSDGMPPSPLETLGRFTFDVRVGRGERGGSLDRGGGGKSTRSRAKSFLKRMESLRLRSGSASKRKKKAASAVSGGRIEISGPVIKEGLDDDKLKRLNCVDIPNLNLNLNQGHVPIQTMTLNRNRSVSYSTQTSSGSSGSSQSEASGGSAVDRKSVV